MLVIKQSSKAWICNTASRAKLILSTGTVSSFLNCLQPNKGQLAVFEEANTLIQDQQHICLGLIQLDLNTCFTMTLDWSWQSRNPVEGVFCRRHKGFIQPALSYLNSVQSSPIPCKTTDLLGNNVPFNHSAGKATYLSSELQSTSSWGSELLNLG